MRKWELFLVLLTFPLMAHASSNDPVLYIGDSYTQGSSGPGATLETLLGGPKDVLRYAMVGASALDYKKALVCPKTGCRADYSLPGVVNGPAHKTLSKSFGGLAALLSEYHPNHVIIELGTNDAESFCTGGVGMPAAAGDLAAAARKAGATCHWIGPISFLKGSEVYGVCGDHYNQYVDDLRSAVQAEGCEFIDMREAGDTAKGCPVENLDYLEPDPRKNCSLQPTDGPKVHFHSGDPQIAMWAKYIVPLLAK